MIVFMKNCPCGSQKLYLSCCGRFINTNIPATTPEELMRSRYTAYTQANMDYIVKTMKSPAADGFDPISAREYAEQSQWTKLEVLHSSTSGNKGTVEFRAHYILNNQPVVLHELSEFRNENGTWYYVDGEEKSVPITTQKIGRNDLCSCGSGKKYKKCCGK